MKKGYIYTALSAIIFGLMPLLTKIIIARGATSLTIAFFRVFYVTVVLFFVLKIKKIDLRLEKRLAICNAYFNIWFWTNNHYFK